MRKEIDKNCFWYGNWVEQAEEVGVEEKVMEREMENKTWVEKKTLTNV